MCFKAASNSSIKTQEFRVRSSSCAMPLYTLEMKAKTLLPLHHDCNLRLDIMHTLLRFIVKKLSQYLGGCWNIHCASAHVVYFKLDVLVFFFKFFFCTTQFMQTQSTWQREDMFCFLRGSNAITVYAFTAILPTTTMKPC